MKKKLFSLSLATVIALSSAISVGADEYFSVDLNTSETPSAIVLWNETYDSVDEIMQNSDVCIVGDVISQSVEDRLGYTGWAGMTNVIDYHYIASGDYPSSVTKSFDLVSIELNYYEDESNQVYDYWQAIACHEFGHAIGLKHLGIVDAENIMQSEIFLTLKEQKENSPITPYNCGQICGGTCDVHQMTNKYS